MADALARVFEDGATELEEVVTGLNRLDVRHPDGGQWTVENYPPAMRDVARGEA